MTKHKFKRTLTRGAGWLLLTCVFAQFPGHSLAQGARNDRYIVGGSPGSGTDILGRIVAEGLSRSLGRSVIVENRPGGGSNLAAELVANSPPDGHTMLQLTTTQATNVTLYKKLNYDLVRDLAPVTELATAPSVIIVHPSLQVKTIRDLIRLAKSKPGAIDYSSGGTGTSSFIAVELFKGEAGIDLTHIPYRGGGDALTAVLSGQTPVSFLPPSSTLPMAKQGKVRALAVTSAQRLPMAPELPTVSESGLPGFEYGNWYGIVVTAKTPKDIIATLHKAAVTALNTPEAKKRLSDMGYITIGSQPEEFAAYIKVEIDRLGKIVRKFNLTAE